MTNPFLDLDSQGLRRGGRRKQRSLKLKESHHTDRKNKELRFHSPKALMILALSAFTSTTTEMCNSIHQCYQARAVEYHDFLETNFDGSVNSLNPLAHIYLSTQSNNEVYNLKEMLQQPDKEYFMEAMRKEVQSMFDEKIWKSMPRREMKEHYAKQRELESR